MWEITIKSQLISFLYAVVVGLLLSVYFDFFRTLRKCISHKNVIIFIEDITFFITATFVTFMLLMARCNGEVRAYVLIAIVAGFFIYRITLSKLIFPLSVWLLNYFLKFVNKIGSIIAKSVLWVIKKAKKVSKICNSSKKTLER